MREERVSVPGMAGYVLRVTYDCGARFELEERSANANRDGMRWLRDQAQQHERLCPLCYDVRQRRERGARRRAVPPIIVDEALRPDETWLIGWAPTPNPAPMTAQEIVARQDEQRRALRDVDFRIDEWLDNREPRLTPAQVEAAIRASPPPQQDIERIVGLSAVLPAPDPRTPTPLPQVGFKVEPKKEPEQKLDRFQLIELD